MARAKQNKLYRTFTKGMITEAGYLTYPEDASIDELNVIISRKGNRTRRRGIDYQENYLLNDLGAGENVAVEEHSWISVNNDPTVSFLVMQIGTKIHFFDMNGEDPLSRSKKNFTLDLVNYKIATANINDLENIPVEFSSGFGLLFVAHPYIDPLSIEYLPESDSLEVIKIVIQIRDLEGVYDGLANDEEPYTLSAAHQYNLQNQGWLSPGTKTLTPEIGDGSTSTPPATTPGAGSDTSTYIDPYTGDQTQYTPGGTTRTEYFNLEQY